MTFQNETLEVYHSYTYIMNKNCYSCFGSKVEEGWKCAM